MGIFSRTLLHKNNNLNIKGFDVDETIYKSLIKTLKANGEKRNSIISEFNDITINDLVRNAKGEEMTFWWFIMHNVLEHETYHRGQIAAYLKVLKGES